MKDLLEIIEDNGYDTDCFQDSIEFDEFRDALIGFTDDFRLVYDYHSVMKKLMDSDGMTSDEAAEYIDYNIIGFHLGGREPIIIYRLHSP